jgi:CDP-diacylglycerol pyrophosphatase
VLFAAWPERAVRPPLSIGLGAPSAGDGGMNRGMRLKPFARTMRFALLLLGAGMAGCDEASAFDLSDRTALWRVVNDLCRPMQQAFKLPLPCLKVDMAGGFAVLRAPGNKTRILIVPTAKIDGIESPAVLGDPMTKFWSEAWSERNRVADSAHRPLEWNDIGMAVNSRRGRSQDQLHIHVDCVDRRLKLALASRASRLSSKWSSLDPGPWGGRYRVKEIDAAGVDRNIFKLVADEIPGAKSSMARQSIAVVGFIAPNGDRGFAVLATADGGHAEELLDHDCSPSE